MTSPASDTTEENDPSSEWYRQAFEAAYLKVYAHRNSKDAAQAIQFLRKEAGLSANLRLLDLCCGAGRHLIQIQSLVPGAIGLDLSRVLLTEAMKAMGEATAPRRAPVQGDMRYLPMRSDSFDVVVNLFTSFGYFDSDRENLSALAEMARVLAPGGVLIFDHINREYLESHLEPRSERRLAEGVMLTEVRRIDQNRSRIEKQVQWVHPTEGAMDWSESVRLYTLEEIKGAMTSVGLHIEQVFGDFEGHSFDPARPRMIVRARKSR